MSEAGWIAIIAAGLSFIATIVGHVLVANTSRQKTIQAVREEAAKNNQGVKDELRGIREESQTKDAEIHAEMLLFKQETTSGLELVRKDIGALSQRVERHNGVIERTYQLEKRADVQEEQIKVANHRIDDLERREK